MHKVIGDLAGVNFRRQVQALHWLVLGLQCFYCFVLLMQCLFHVLTLYCFIDVVPAPYAYTMLLYYCSACSMSVHRTVWYSCSACSCARTMTCPGAWWTKQCTLNQDNVWLLQPHVRRESCPTHPSLYNKIHVLVLPRD